MIDGAPEIFVALEQSGFSASIRQSPWLYPAANVGHIIFLVLFAAALTRGSRQVTDPLRLRNEAKSPLVACASATSFGRQWQHV